MKPAVDERRAVGRAAEVPDGAVVADELVGDGDAAGDELEVQLGGGVDGRENVAEDGPSPVSDDLNPGVGLLDPIVATGADIAGISVREEDRHILAELGRELLGEHDLDAGRRIACDPGELHVRAVQREVDDGGHGLAFEGVDPPDHHAVVEEVRRLGAPIAVDASVGIEVVDHGGSEARRLHIEQRQVDRPGHRLADSVEDLLGEEPVPEYSEAGLRHDGPEAGRLAVGVGRRGDDVVAVIDARDRLQADRDVGQDEVCRPAQRQAHEDEQVLVGAQGHDAHVLRFEESVRTAEGEGIRRLGRQRTFTRPVPTQLDADGIVEGQNRDARVQLTRRAKWGRRGARPDVGVLEALAVVAEPRPAVVVRLAVVRAAHPVAA